MKSFAAIIAILFCVVVAVSAQYNQAAPSYQQRKLAPVPQTYGQAPAPYAPKQYQAAPKYAPAAYAKPAPAYSAPAYSAPAPAPASYAAPQPAYQEPNHPPSPFAWGYDINDGYGGAQFHKETGDEYGKRTGSYGYTDAYGIYRQVDYVADEYGFRAVIKSNEPGVDDKPQSPASVELHHYEPPTNHYAAQQQNEYSAPAPAQQSYAQAPKQYSAPAYAPSKQAYAPAQSYSNAPAAYNKPAGGYGPQQQADAYAPAQAYGRQQYGGPKY